MTNLIVLNNGEHLLRNLHVCSSSRRNKPTLICSLKYVEKYRLGFHQKIAPTQSQSLVLAKYTQAM